MSKLVEVRVPDIGDFEGVEVIEVLVAPGDAVQAEDSLISLESDKATMEVPSPQAGVVKELRVAVGNDVSEGDVILTLEASDVAESETPASLPAAVADPVPQASQESKPQEAPPAAPGTVSVLPTSDDGGADDGKPHASPSVRRFARELGVPLTQVQGGGRKGRITRDDVQSYVKAALQGGAVGSGTKGLLPWPDVDFTKFGAVDIQSLSRINRISGANLARNWAMIPHVTQHDEADITDMEAFRKAHADEAQTLGFKLTPLAFLIKASVAALKKFPRCNASLDASGETLVLKRYFHIGVAVETDEGLMVPVIRDCDRKSLLELAAEVVAMSVKARDKKLAPTDMQGGCFSISSLGGIGGTAFTPIVNAPEVAILGVSRAAQKPVWDGGEFRPRLMLPLSLSYDHRVIDGALAARFTAYLSYMLSDLRRLLL